MSSSLKPTLVFVHGAWHDPSCFDLVREPLESQGYKCHVPELPSIGEFAATKTASDDVMVVRVLVEGCLSRGEDVVIIGHSHGGVKANEALEGLIGPENPAHEGRGRVLGLVLMAGLLPPLKRSEVVPDDSRWIFSETEPTLIPKDPTHLFYNDMSPHRAAYWASRIRPMHTQEMPGEGYEAWRHLPVSYLVCTDDNALPVSWQRAMIQDTRTKGGVVHTTEVRSGHSPFLSRPEDVVEWILRAVKEELT